MNDNNSFWLDYVRKSNKELNDIVERDLHIVSSIDAKIMQLLEQRNYMLHGLNCRCLAHKNAQTCLGINAMAVWKEYVKEGFNGSNVKSAVSNLRSLFFDDSKEKFQKFYCTQIDYYEYGSDNDDLYFIFEDNEGHAMRFAFNVKQYENKYLYKYKCLNGRVYFQTLAGRDFNTVNMSFDVYEMRKVVEEWIDSGFEMQKHEFDHLTLLDKINDNFKEFEDIGAYSMYFRNSPNEED